MLPKCADGTEAGIALPQLCELLARRLALQEPDEIARRAFRAFDEKSKGYISLRDFEAVMGSIAPHLPCETVSLVFSEIDTDRDGRVSFKDFHSMMSARPIGARWVDHRTEAWGLARRTLWCESGKF
uniref:EF-hand domain-containing protein n=1 Tax=Haptolina brevifila TaxID=156173 RepID=A0A7S2N9F7_9EUKA|mmetsp:Transcript_70670/g.140072  ORF Transcript_70670/g.140072 Transcript_70670/m.140072 type:complete len:127 (+) Transcript_70670:34-414(+)